MTIPTLYHSVRSTPSFLRCDILSSITSAPKYSRTTSPISLLFLSGSLVLHIYPVKTRTSAIATLIMLVCALAMPAPQFPSTDLGVGEDYQTGNDVSNPVARALRSHSHPRVGRAPSYFQRLPIPGGGFIDRIGFANEQLTIEPYVRTT
ncbi:uncharacterized protein BDV17DRAFT_271111 [Aspergillus undulatus]|uniref:uncharacterized protein n=1 Tax=Aspergillus undulatus TaxID=1810928 RepID=UPI003CCD9A4A